MKKNIFYKTCLALTICASLIGCSNNSNTVSTEETNASESVSISIDDTEPATEHVDSTTGSVQDAIVTVGTLKDLSEVIDNYGNKQALFTGEDGNDFIAIVSEQTLLPDDLSVDHSYEVHHSDVMTMSIPGQYPEVYEIKNVDNQSDMEASTEQDMVEETTAN